MIASSGASADASGGSTASSGASADASGGSTASSGAIADTSGASTASSGVSAASSRAKADKLFALFQSLFTRKITQKRKNKPSIMLGDCCLFDQYSYPLRLFRIPIAEGVLQRPDVSAHIL